MEEEKAERRHLEGKEKTERKKFLEEKTKMQNLEEKGENQSQADITEADRRNGKDRQLCCYLTSVTFNISIGTL